MMTIHLAVILVMHVRFGHFVHYQWMARDTGLHIDVDNQESAGVPASSPSELAGVTVWPQSRRFSAAHFMCCLPDI